MVVTSINIKWKPFTVLAYCILHLIIHTELIVITRWLVQIFQNALSCILWVSVKWRIIFPVIFFIIQVLLKIVLKSCLVLVNPILCIVTPLTTIILNSDLKRYGKLLANIKFLTQLYNFSNNRVEPSLSALGTMAEPVIDLPYILGYKFQLHSLSLRWQDWPPFTNRDGHG